MSPDEELDLYVHDSAAELLKCAVQLQRRIDEIGKLAASGDLQKVIRSQDVKKARSQLDIARGAVRVAQQMLASLLTEEGA